ncbi:MAG: hypothetical protein ABI678_23215, partial [Kofleriaceae bacterium]
MRLGLLCALISTAGCRQVFGVDTPGAPALDAASDAFRLQDGGPSDASQHACFTVAALGLMACVDQVLPPLEATTDMTIDTSGNAFCDTSSTRSDLCVVAASAIVIPAGVRIAVTGSRPLVIYATGTIAITGTLDLASHVGGATGAGADPMTCASGSRPSGAGGGAGGSFGTKGGHGGAASLLGGTGGAAAGVGGQAVLRGGCAGQNGGGVTGGGAGGGALLLVADDQILIAGAGIVNASGQS